MSNPSYLPRLSIMMFLQFFAWGSWFVTLKLALETNDLATIISRGYESAPIGAIFAPLFLGLIADRFFASEKVMAALMLLGAALMTGVAVLSAGGAENAEMIGILMVAYMCCFMPTLGLANTITFTHLSQDVFPKARVWGTIGWIVAGLVVAGLGWSYSLMIFWLAAGCSLVLGIYCFTLPATPPPAKGEAISVRSLLMLDAFGLLKSFPFAIFAISSTLICIPLGYYYAQTASFLGSAGYREPSSFMTIGQMSEIFFMLLVPFFFRKLGVKMMLMIGMGCWIARYGLFAMGAPDQVAWMLLLGVALHGICYDFFFVTGFIYTDKKAPVSIRGQAQSLLVFLTQGLGMFFGFRFAFGGNFPFLDGAKLPNTIALGDSTFGAPPSDELVNAIKAANEGAPEKSIWESLLGMFDKGYPEGIDSSLIPSSMAEWKLYWIFPLILATGILVFFGLLFWDKVKRDDPEKSDAGAR